MVLSVGDAMIFKAIITTMLILILALQAVRYFDIDSKWDHSWRYHVGETENISYGTREIIHNQEKLECAIKQAASCYGGGKQ
jgi:hypothetical protein